MSLRWYRIPRMAVLKPQNTVMEAARALENNNIGAAIVQDQGRVLGIVTDRDLTVRVAGAALDPRATALSQVMSNPVATLSPGDDQRDALRLMRQRNVRRIPPDELSAVVEAQIGGGGPASSRRTPAERRRAARAAATYGHMLNRLTTGAQLESSDDADVAMEIVLSAVVRRLTPDEADDLIAQLPSLTHAALRALPAGPDKGITRSSVESTLSDALRVELPRAAEIMGEAGKIVAQAVSPGEIQDVRSQLPADLRCIFPEPIPAGA